MLLSTLASQRLLRSGVLALLALVCSLGAEAQTPACAATSAATLVHQEGLAEKTGDLTLACNGGTSGSAVSATLFVTLNTNITNRLDINGNPAGIVVTANAGACATATGG